MKKVLVGLFVLIVIIAGIVAFFILNSKPDKLSEKDKVEAIGEILGRKPNLDPNIKTGNNKFEGKYVTFSYPARAKIYEYRDPDFQKSTSLLDSFSFNIETPRILVFFTVDSAEGLTTIDDIPAVKFRKDPGSGYKQSEITADGESGIAFEKTGSGEIKAEKTGFFSKNNKTYTISVSGNNLEDVSELFDSLIKSFVFVE